MAGRTMKTTDSTTERNSVMSDLNDRSREVFRRVVEGYLETGAPVGSRTLTRSLSEQVSAATVRNVMQDLEYLGRARSNAAWPADVRRRLSRGWRTG
jgi:heat-inducible transcriptional repressor